MKLFLDLNDLELIYLIYENNPTAYELMMNKYSILIDKILYEFHAPYRQMEDLKQEGLLILNECIYKYDDSYGKTFFQFFSMSLKRRLYRLIKKEYDYQTHNVLVNDEYFNASLLSTVPDYIPSVPFKEFKTKLEEEIFKEILLGNVSVNHFCQKRNLDKKVVYNKIYYMKKKYKKYFESLNEETNK